MIYLHAWKYVTSLSNISPTSQYEMDKDAPMGTV